MGIITDILNALRDVLIALGGSAAFLGGLALVFLARRSTNPLPVVAGILLMLAPTALFGFMNVFPGFIGDLGQSLPFVGAMSRERSAEADINEMSKNPGLNPALAPNPLVKTQFELETARREADNEGEKLRKQCANTPAGSKTGACAQYEQLKKTEAWNNPLTSLLTALRGPEPTPQVAKSTSTERKVENGKTSTTTRTSEESGTIWSGLGANIGWIVIALIIGIVAFRR